METSPDRFCCCDLRRGLLFWAGLQIFSHTLVPICIAYLYLTHHSLTPLILTIPLLIFSFVDILVHSVVIFGITHQRRGYLLLALIYYYVIAVILFFLLGYLVINRPITAAAAIGVFGMRTYLYAQFQTFFGFQYSTTIF